MITESEFNRFSRNNLGESSSPYLIQHSGNPVWWQEWDKETLEYAIESKKPLLVSIGYSTCHWCHVMASEAFSDMETATFLNENFLCIKIDREQRPDIDEYMMQFIRSQSENGGWPLNVFLTHDMKPVVALTYAPAINDDYRLSFLEIARRVISYIKEKGDEISPFTALSEDPPVLEEESLTGEISLYYDNLYGGFGTGQKFPSHSTLLFLLYYLAVKEDNLIKSICSDTLDVMILSGLNDHLQGGIFRYCVDRRWKIPHFEKMLYDQAMALWTYSLAFRITGHERYKTMVHRILRCLDECFEKDGLYISAIDADTDHREGATYLWSINEIKDLLGSDDFNKFREVYEISEDGNFEGKNHLLRKCFDPLDEIEEKLLSARRQRQQPLNDDKILCGVNALTAIGLIQTGRFLDRPDLEQKGGSLIRRLLEIFWDGTTLGHSYFNGRLQHQSFLSDAGVMLTAITMLYESDEKWREIMDLMAGYVETFRKEGKWIESKAEDFQEIYSSWFDHPIPSGVSLASAGLTRSALLTDKDCPAVPYRRPLQSDFYNLSALMQNGLFHLYTSEKYIPWVKLPANSLQKRGIPETDCYKGSCHEII